MKSNSVTIPIKEESEEKLLENETEVETEKLEPLVVSKFSGYLYCLWFTIYLKSNDDRFGQKTPVFINDRYIIPYGWIYVAVFSILAIIPSIILRFLRTSDDTPFNFQKSIFFLLSANCLYTYNNANGIYSIMGPVYYLKYRYEEGSIGNSEAIIATIYVFAFILGFKFTWGFMKESYKMFLEMVKLWNLVKLQLRPQPDTLV